MPTLRLTQFAEGKDQHRLEIALEGDGRRHLTAVSRFIFALTAEDQEDIRWYLEDYLQCPFEPAPRIAARIEARMAELGAELFAAIFQSNDEVRDLWASVRQELDKTRLEIASGVREATSIPWELLREPSVDMPLSLRAHSFVRTSFMPAQAPGPPRNDAGPVRVLLVICRPGGPSDVPFRSVANRLLRGLGARQGTVEFTVLRPPTFERLSRVLWDAKPDGAPFHIVHFDGHGTYGEGGPQPGARGYLIFENPAFTDNQEAIDGRRIGELLAHTNVPVLILNACRSAYAGPPSASPRGAPSDANTEARAFTSLAQEIMDASAALAAKEGTPGPLVGVVAMRYNVYVEPAARFMTALYTFLAQGRTLGEAVKEGRRQLYDEPRRSIAFELPLQDWGVPVVFEAAPLAVFPKQPDGGKLTISLGAGSTAASKAIATSLPAPPDAGFFGRDETLLALDRAFDTQRVVLLHAYAGSGKTSAAAEFARWYSLTAGLGAKGKAIFTSFDQYRPLARVLDQLGEEFDRALEQAGVNWLALRDVQRREVALQTMGQVPVLWIWDSVEQVAGFPSGTSSRWTVEEQRELADFLRAACETQTKFLLTSRREEVSWLGDLPARVSIPPMPFQESVQLTRALVEKRGRRLTHVKDWRPLLEFTQGNPLTITVLVGQALHDRLTTRGQVEAYVARLRAGEADFKDEESEGRSRSLAASLNYGFESAFNARERKRLALLHLFQGFVNTTTLWTMGALEDALKGGWRLPEIRGLTRESWIILLDRAAEVGLLTSVGAGCYSMHPALPWFFKKLFDEHYTGSERRAIRAFVVAMAGMGSYYHNEYEKGVLEVTKALDHEEANLRDAYNLGRKQRLWNHVLGATQGLQSLYDHTGRQKEWARLVEEVTPDYVDPSTGEPHMGLGNEWPVVTDYRVRLVMRARLWSEADRVQRRVVQWSRERASAALARPPEKLHPEHRIKIRTLSVALERLAQIQCEVGEPECIRLFEEAYDLDLRINDPAASHEALNLGLAYKNLPAVRDLDNSERWANRALELTPKEDRAGRARCFMLLGSVALQRSSEAENASAPEAEVHRHLESALQFYRQALNLFPDDAVGDLAVVYNQLGKIHEVRREWEPALTYYRRSIHCEEKQDHQHGAGLTRRNVADVLAKQRRFADAKEYALTASQDFEACGEGAKEDLLETLKLMAKVMELQGDICGAGQTHSKVARLLAESARFADAKEYALAALRGFEACGQGKEQEVALKLYMEIDKGLQAQGSGARNQKRE